jgi:hypothetical protein
MQNAMAVPLILPISLLSGESEVVVGAQWVSITPLPCYAGSLAVPTLQSVGHMMRMCHLLHDSALLAPFGPCRSASNVSSALQSASYVSRSG